ncbi:MAG TPA: PspC domain-containing protein [Anaerolineae bacterium]|nr:PspC domain-containing protein [Anaerolineae bacterium]
MSSKRLVRSTNDRMVAGVAAGVANYVGLDVTLIRILFVLLAVLAGHGILIYIILWLVMPEADFVGSVADDDEEIIIEKGGM